MRDSKRGKDQGKRRSAYLTGTLDSSHLFEHSAQSFPLLVLVARLAFTPWGLAVVLSHGVVVEAGLGPELLVALLALQGILELLTNLHVFLEAMDCFPGDDGASGTHHFTSLWDCSLPLSVRNSSRACCGRVFSGGLDWRRSSLSLLSEPTPLWSLHTACLQLLLYLSHTFQSKCSRYWGLFSSEFLRCFLLSSVLHSLWVFVRKRRGKAAPLAFTSPCIRWRALGMRLLGVRLDWQGLVNLLWRLAVAVLFPLIFLVGQLPILRGCGHFMGLFHFEEHWRGGTDLHGPFLSVGLHKSLLKLRLLVLGFHADSVWVIPQFVFLQTHFCGKHGLTVGTAMTQLFSYSGRDASQFLHFCFRTTFPLPLCWLITHWTMFAVVFRAWHGSNLLLGMSMLGRSAPRQPWWGQLPKLGPTWALHALTVEQSPSTRARVAPGHPREVGGGQGQETGTKVGVFFFPTNVMLHGNHTCCASRSGQGELGGPERKRTVVTVVLSPPVCRRRPGGR